MSAPAPRYGEYASPEQQQSARGLPPEPQASPQIPDAAPRPDLRIDRIIVFALLAYGLFTVISSGIRFQNVASLMNEIMATTGVPGEFTNYESGRTWGLIATTVLVIGWTLTALWSLRRMRSQRRTWWVPLVGGLVFTVLAAMCLLVPFMGDPAFVEYIRQAG